MEQSVNNTNKNIFINRYRALIPVFKEEKTKSITSLSLTIIAFSIFGYFAINPTIATIAQLKKQLSDNHYVFDKLDEKIKNLGYLQQQYTILGKDIFVVSKAIPQIPTVPLLTAQLQAVALNNHMTIKRLQVFQIELVNASSETTSQKNLEFPRSFSFALDLEGSLLDITNYLSSLTNFERIVTIDTLAITKSGGENNSKISLRGKAYFNNSKRIYETN